MTINEVNSNFCSEILIPEDEYKLFDEDVLLLEEASTEIIDTPYLEIIRQPDEKFRFRYETEMIDNFRKLMSKEKNSSKRAYPTVKLHGYGKKAFIRLVVCRTDEELYKLHFHSFLTKNSKKEEYNKDPVYSVVNKRNNFTAEFSGTILSTLRKDFSDRLKEKVECIQNLHPEEDDINLDTSDFWYTNQNIVVLRFDAFDFETNEKICPPVFSKPISNLKSSETGRLKISRMNLCSADCLGGDEMFLLVERVPRDIRVRFYNKNWSTWAQVIHIHHQFALVILIPQYYDLNIQEPVGVYVELVRGEESSPPVNFVYIPRKR